jgi:hypothetical protein
MNACRPASKLELVEPLRKHGPCEPDVRADSDAGEPSGADGVVGPAGLDGQELGGLLGS